MEYKNNAASRSPSAISPSLRPSFREAMCRAVRQIDQRCFRKDEQERADLAMIIEEVLLQRCQGVKNEKGVWVTPAFPKLIYVLEENNIHEDSKYYYLTKLAAKCTAKRMVPDYISEKIMLKNKIDKKNTL